MIREATVSHFTVTIIYMAHAFNLVVDLFQHQNLLYGPKLKKQEGFKLYKLEKILFSH